MDETKKVNKMLTVDGYNGKKIKRIEYEMDYDSNPSKITIIFEDEDRPGSIYADTPKLDVFAFYNSDKQVAELEIAGTEKPDTHFKYGINDKELFKLEHSRK